MSKQIGKSQKRYKPNHFYSILSVAFVLFLFGIFGTLIMFSNNLSDYFKEQIKVAIELKDNTTEIERIQLQTFLKAEDFVKTLQYISKEDALASMQDNNGFEDVEDLVGQNPLYNSFDIYLKAEFATNEHISKISNSIKSFSCVKTVYYHDALVEGINETTKNIGLIILIISAFILIVTLTLINSTVRLSMYSQRFIIKNMQLVGAKSFFIIKPFLTKGLTNGFISGALASILMVLIIHYSQEMLPDLKLITDPTQLVILLGIIIFIGIFISTASTMIAVRKYLKMKLDDLY